MKYLYTLMLAILLLGGCATVSQQPVPNTDAAAQAVETDPDQPTASTLVTEALPTDIIISAVGDIMLDGSSRRVMAEQGYDYPFVHMHQYFADAQIVFGNVEGPLTDRGTPDPDKTFVFRSPPDEVAAALKTAGFNVVSLANNHTLDYGAEGLAQTLAALDAVGIQYAGAGADLMAARKPALLTKGVCAKSIRIY